MCYVNFVVFLTLGVGVLELVLQRLALALRKGLHKSESLRWNMLALCRKLDAMRCKTYILTADSRNHIVGGCAE